MNAKCELVSTVNKKRLGKKNHIFLAFFCPFSLVNIFKDIPDQKLKK